jgi:2-keto-4-pentenoate hydratase/2-oxohepta-3-ene-1,7-dioic acid hydratase in catechol pathway
LTRSLPIGPWLVTKDEVPEPQNLPIRCTVNGDVLQDSNTREMVFGVAELVSVISQTIALVPGDIICTGTPSGVGFARKPPRFLSHGDEVTVSIQGLGELTNTVQAET